MNQRASSLTLSKPTQDEYYVVYVDEAFPNAWMDLRNPNELFFELYSMKEDRMKSMQAVEVSRKKDLPEDDYPHLIFPERFLEGYSLLGELPTPYRVLTWIFERYDVREPDKAVIDQFMPFFKTDQKNHLIKRLSHLFQQSHDDCMTYTRMMAEVMGSMAEVLESKE